jgi:hypothetical protein
MWIILLDHSASMRNAFEASDEAMTLRDRRADAPVKLAAAIECVLVDLARLPRDVPVSLFGFANSAELLAEGPAGEHSAFVGALERLHAGGGTNIAAALDSARSHGESVSPRPLVIRILLVTDGLSDVREAVSAARECASSGIPVDVALIDPTARARQLAAKVAGVTGGRWEPVFGPRDLEHATSQARASVAAMVQRTEEAVRRSTDEAAKVDAEVAGRDAVLFSASYPGVITRAAWHPLYVHMYSESLRPELEAKLADRAEHLGSRPRRRDAPANSAIAPGTALEIQPVVHGVRCRPSRLTVEWKEELEEARFEAEYAGQADAEDICSGVVLVAVEGLPIAQIPVSFIVSSSPAETAPFLTASARMIRDVFGSYAHEDADIVSRFRAAYRALGIRLFIDTLDIDGGQPWKRYLRQQIDSSDLFQLFWSQAAAASAAVEDEWRHALDVARARPPGTAFIRPVYWSQPPPSPPEPLAELHFRYVDPQTLGISAARNATDQQPAPPAPSSKADVRFPVVPLVDEWDSSTADHIQEALRSVVPFIEELTGLRYYPPVTYLTDEVTVIDLRKSAEPDARWLTEPPRPTGTPLTASQEKAIRRLGDLLLQFSKYAEQHPRAWSRDLPDIRREADGGFIADVRDFLQGRPPGTRQARDQWRVYTRSRDFPSYAATYIDLLVGFLEHQIHVPQARRLAPGQIQALRGQYGDAVARALERKIGKRTPEPGHIDETYTANLARAGRAVVRMLRERPDPPKVSGLLRAAAPAFAVFQYRGTAPPSARLSGGTAPASAPAVLICRNAFERVTSGLREQHLAEEETRQLAQAFLTSTLVHEHTHAALATGLDNQGLAATAAGTTTWADGHNLNEALAAWTQRHYHRDNPLVFAECSRYISTGTYPSWPYAGADVLEKLYGATGMKEIRQYIHMLRQTPEIAQQKFDSLASADTHTVMTP